MIKYYKLPVAAIASIMLLGFAESAHADTVVFQDGTDNAFVTNYSGTEDTMLASNTWEASYGSRQNIQVGASLSPVDHGLLRFDLSSLQGVYSSIDSVTLRLYLNGSTGVGATAYTETLQVYSVSSANSGWIEGVNETIATNGQSTWHYLSQTGSGTGTTWAGSQGASTTGTDYDSTLLASYNYDNTGRESYIDLTISGAVIESWITGENAGLLFKTTTEAATGDLDKRIEFYSSEVTTESLRPSLIINFTAIPEPSSAALVSGLLVVGGAILIRKRRVRA
ncbi:DNRLRE domain-containing protein [Coraliomargarita parva]|uniref:DNRLRE domain-containing protein n=1 Tax=Coraliomargarita parva TaxID=3014050 RepID=UPI0022B4252F|nr:DNRLRE domain-containing protein [Coraliomargarita parva]